jgi:endonuclease III
VYKANFNSTKARRILTAAERVKKDLKGEMPQTYEDVMLFEGVGEKIALLYMLVAMKHV